MKEPEVSPAVPSYSSYFTPGNRTHHRIKTAAVLLTVLLVCIEVFSAREISDQAYSGVLFNRLSVARVTDGSPGHIAGFRKGDRVVSLDDRECGSVKGFSTCIARMRPGETVTFGLMRGDLKLTVPVTLSSLPVSEILRKVSLLIVGFSFLAIGLLVYFRRADRVALVFYLFCLAFGFTLTGVVTAEVGRFASVPRLVVSDLLALSLPILLLHFFLLFPDRRLVLGGHPRLEYLIYVPAIVLFPITVYFNVMESWLGRAHGDLLTVLKTATALHFIAFIILGLVAFVNAYRHVTAHAMRRKLRLVVYSTIVGILPMAVILVVISIMPAVEVPGEKLAFLPLVLVPVAFGHAIVRYGLFDLEIVIKRSLVYTLLIAILASVYFAVVYGIGRVVSRYAGSGDLPFSIISIFVITLLISPVRARIRLAVDRMFFRQEYNYRKVLKQISHSLAGIIGMESLVSYLGVRVPEVLNARTGVVFLLDEKSGRHVPRYGYRVDHAMLKALEADATLCTHLTRTHATFNVERRLASNRPLPIAPAEAEILLRAESALVVPFIFKSTLLGFITIGRKESDEFYSVTDIELLETLCDQVSLAIENANLYLETVEKQKMEQELELAREIQHRLLPKTFPEIEGLETHAVNIPSKHVGGDYFDIIPLGDETVAMVIADVSGKGVPAALLMASLQSSLRAEADVSRRPSEVISAVNRVIFEHTAGGTFVTIFYGLLDLARGSLTYCNAGHPPPLVLDAVGGIRELDGTDIVIGIDDQASYRDTEAEVAAGDKVFLYTDGVTDELNEDDEPYGEKRLITVLRQNYGSGLEDIVECVHKSVLEFTDGKPQDDLTALAVKITRVAFCNERNPSSGKAQTSRKS